MHSNNFLPDRADPRTATIALLLLAAGLVLTALLYLPGLSGPWVLDDFQNLGPFLDHAPGAAPYHELVFSNAAGPLGRPVAMASFALNHALGLFSPAALKATNLVLHLLNGTLLFLLLRALFRHRSPTARLAPDLLAALLAVWWLLLPLHLSTVFYVVQRMTLLSTLFRIAASLAYFHGRCRLATRPRQGAALMALSLLVLFPLSLFSKETAATFLAGIVLIELFFFRPQQARTWLSMLALLVLAILVAVTVATPEPLAQAFVGRDFTLGERLLSEPRALWSYVRSIFLPAGADLGVFHDDFAVSRTLLSPPTTLAALAGLLGVIWLALRQAGNPRTWAVAFGVGVFLTGHLLESTLLPLELYFEHRNYWPSRGLLLAAAVLALEYWPGSRRGLALAAGLYLALTAGVTALQADTWGSEARLLASAARHHPHSARANDVWIENLVGQGRLDDAVAGSEAFAADNPPFALAARLHALSIYCRAGAPVPAALVRDAAASPPYSLVEADLLALNLRNILRSRARGRCLDVDFTALAAPLAAWDRRLAARYGDGRRLFWNARLGVAEWLAATGHAPEAMTLLRDIYAQDARGDLAPAGILLASLLLQAGHAADAAGVVERLAAPAQDRTPPPVRPTIALLQRALAQEAAR